jgi:hypothetical protein
MANPTTRPHGSGTTVSNPSNSTGTRLEPVSAENSVTSCDLHVFMDESAEAVPAQWRNREIGRPGSAVVCWWALLERSVRPVRVVVVGVLPQYPCEVAWSGNQEVIEAFAAQGADPAFGVGVRCGGPHGCAQDPDSYIAEDCVECRGELGVAVADKEAKLPAGILEIPS